MSDINKLVHEGLADVIVGAQKKYRDFKVKTGIGDTAGDRLSKMKDDTIKYIGDKSSKANEYIGVGAGKVKQFVQDNPEHFKGAGIAAGTIGVGMLAKKAMANNSGSKRK